MLLVCGYGVSANAQMTFVLSGMERVDNTRWKYGTVTCTSGADITSIILSMKNNNIETANSSGIPPTRTITSSGINPRTILYLFTPALTPDQVENFIKGITFIQTTELSGENPYVNISVDANPTYLPGGGSTITAWGHPDGTQHYYVWVPEASIPYEKAYNDAKKYYFQGMRGYLATVTSAGENSTLTNISPTEGWSGGARTPDVISDKITITRPTRDNTYGRNYRWLCGPETDFFYHYGPTYSQGGAMNGAFAAWNNNEPNDSSGSENVMQVNYTAALLWNDYSPTNGAIKGYFIEFGGTGKEYKVGSATYPANDKYNEDKLNIPDGGLTNEQWVGFSPGNRVSTATTFKPNSMRANVLVVE